MAPTPTPVFRLVHLDNLAVVLRRQGLHAPNFTPNDGEVYRAIHRQDVQGKRKEVAIPCGPGGTAHDYVPFYFGYRSPMLFQLKTGQVAGYNDGQDPLIYLTTKAQIVSDRGGRFVFSDGHGLAKFTDWFDDLAKLENVDWEMVYRQRRKQAEFLVYRFCPWDWIEEIGVLNEAAVGRVKGVFGKFSATLSRPVLVRPDWYYP
jgi:hypothetical protein